MSPGFSSGFWRLADPKISLASMASILLGACSASLFTPIHPGWLALTILGIFFIEVAKNASGEIFDFNSGTDLAIDEPNRSPFSGGKRVLVDGLLTRAETWTIAITGYTLALITGLIIVFKREPGILWLGLAGMALAFLYHAPPIKLSYRGLGELAVGICYGPGICCGTFIVQTGRLESISWIVGIPLGLLIAAFLWINEFPDHDADLASGKRNCVVLLGKKRASRVFALLMTLAFSFTILLPVLDVPTAAWVGLVGAIPAFIASKILWSSWETTKKIIPAQSLTLISFLLYAAGAGFGLALLGK